MTNIYSRLLKFLTFEDNWNGYGAVTFSEIYIHNCIDLVERLHADWMEVYPLSDGRIQLESTYNGIYVEAEVNHDMKLHVYIEKSDKPYQEFIASEEEFHRILRQYFPARYEYFGDDEDGNFVCV